MMQETLIEISPRLAHFELINRVRISVNPDEVVSVVESPRGTEIALRTHADGTFYLVSGSYEDVLLELNRASM